MPTDVRGRHRPIMLTDRVAFRRWRAWARHTILTFVDGKPEEDPEDAWRRRWHDLPDRTKDEFRQQAETVGGGTAQVDRESQR